MEAVRVRVVVGRSGAMSLLILGGVGQVWSVVSADGWANVVGLLQVLEGADVDARVEVVQSARWSGDSGRVTV